MQYVNFFPGEWNNDHKYMSGLFSYAKQHHIGLGGPDVVPFRKSQMKNSYLFFLNKNKLSNIGMAIQEGDYTYKKTDSNTYYKFSDFYLFAK